MADDAQIPPKGARAANVLLDAVISQSATQSTEANIRAMSVALAALASEEPTDDEPEPSDVVGAAVVCISWLSAHLAAASAVDLEDVVADLRDFLDSVSAR
ncbi:hypothetical protein N1031_17105 [Herbiconiux moechotypicola]|uniref:hypothetical protein n=1 Tax=Herbiconiux moechotypicola TaxID=637393 RepID=UPI00217E6DBC|nr:hypothetical protein [Herbiconiux moechotypicola]MCS5731482.1 hypothetical protein [Herbiconiux moechotypicola]